MVRPQASQSGRSVVMVGGGVIGLACARALLIEGCRVTVVDPGDATKRATWAAGGMLAPLGEAPEAGPFLDLGLESLRAYPRFVAELEKASGESVGLHLNGKILTAAQPEEIEKLRARFDWLTREGHRVQWLTGEEVQDLEPATARAVQAGILLEGNGRVDPRRLHHALVVAVSRAGGAWLYGQRVASVTAVGGRVTGVRLEDGTAVEADSVVLSAGAWAGGIEGIPHSLPVRPIKGQMLALATPTPPLSRVVTSANAYLIPRLTPQGPAVVVGATTEESGFRTDLSEEGQEALAVGARALVPALTDAPVVERWAGLRPATPDALPVLGEDPELAGLVLAAGHYRNGILLAPATAARIRDAVVGRSGDPHSAILQPEPRRAAASEEGDAPRPVRARVHRLNDPFSPLRFRTADAEG